MAREPTDVRPPAAPGGTTKADAVPSQARTRTGTGTAMADLMACAGGGGGGLDELGRSDQLRLAAVRGMCGVWKKRGGGSNAPKGRKKIAPDEMFNMGKMSYRQHSQRQANMRHIYHTYI